MPTNRKQARKHEHYNGFAVPLAADTELGLAMLIAEDEEGHTQPIACASTIAEAAELAYDDFRNRMRRLEANEDAGICPLCRARHNGHYAEFGIMPSGIS